jgi:hypothetical protein
VCLRVADISVIGNKMRKLKPSDGRFWMPGEVFDHCLEDRGDLVSKSVFLDLGNDKT